MNFKQRQQYLQLFAEAMAPLVKVALIRAKREHCKGCKEKRPGPHAHLCQQDYFPEVLQKLKYKIAPTLLQQIPDFFRSLRHTGHFRRVNISAFSSFLVDCEGGWLFEQLCWNEELWRPIEDLLLTQWNKEREEAARRTQD